MQSSNSQEYLSKLYFIDQNNGWICGSNGTLLNTQDGGDTWVSLPPITTSTIRDVFFTNEELGWVCGHVGLILHTDNGGAVGFNEENCSYSTGNNTRLYPNPTNQSINLDIEIDSPCQIDVDLYSVEGKYLKKIKSGYFTNHFLHVEENNLKIQPGLYYIIIMINTEKRVEKLIVIQ
jgi:hypothetical protein